MCGGVGVYTEHNYYKEFELKMSDQIQYWSDMTTRTHEGHHGGSVYGNIYNMTKQLNIISRAYKRREGMQLHYLAT